MTVFSKIPKLELLMQVTDDVDRHKSKRSTEVKCGKQCSIATKLRKNR